MSARAEGLKVDGTTYAVLFAISFCHMLNDMMQSLLPALYPSLKASLALSFTQIGLVTLVYQATASLLQPMVGFLGDKRPLPYTLPAGAAFSLFGLLVLSVAHSYPILLGAAALVGIGSSTFHPESSRVARLAAGGRFGFAQSLFQVGGNVGSAIGPLLAAFIVLNLGQGSVAYFGGLALISIFTLWRVALWYKTHGLARARRSRRRLAVSHLPRKKVMVSLAILLLLIFSKHFYLAAFQSYYTFYLIERFHLSVQSAQIHLFIFLATVTIGTLVGGPIGDRYGRKLVIWVSILGVLPFTLALPYVGLEWTWVVTSAIALILSSAFSAIVVYGQELVPSKVGTISGMFFGAAFGFGGIGAAVLGQIADIKGIEYVFWLVGFLPLLGLLVAFLPNLDEARLKPPADAPAPQGEEPLA